MWKKWWLRNLRLPDDEGAGESEGGGTGTEGSGEGEGEGKGKPGGEQSEEVKLLTKTVSQLAEGLAAMQQSQSAMTDALSKISKGGDSDKPDKPEPSTADILKDADVDSMDQKSLAAFILENVSKVLDAKMSKLMEGVDERVTGLAGEFQQQNAATQVQKIAEAHPDFFEWAPEIKRLLQENPTLSVQRAFTLAKEENPDKKAAMVKKYKKTPAQNEGKPRVVGGLTPTSSKTTGTGKMTAREAAEKAMDETLADIEGLLSKDVAFK